MNIKSILAAGAFSALLPLSGAIAADGIPGGARDGARTGERAAGPLGGAVGGLVGGAVGGATGAVKGVLGIPQSTGPRRGSRRVYRNGRSYRG